MSFKEYKKVFEDKNCKLLIKEEDFNKIKCKSTFKFDIISSCGHNHSVHYNVFKNRNSGVKCPKCVIEFNKKNKIFINNNGENKINISMQKSFILLNNLIKNNFDFKKSSNKMSKNEYDLKDKNNIDWIKIQILSTSLNNNSFCPNNYSKNFKIIFLINTLNSKIWLINKNIIKNNQIKITIGNNNSKYDNFLIDKNNFLEKIKNCIDEKEEYNIINNNDIIVNNNDNNDNNDNNNNDNNNDNNVINNIINNNDINDIINNNDINDIINDNVSINVNDDVNYDVNVNNDVNDNNNDDNNEKNIITKKNKKLRGKHRNYSYEEFTNIFKEKKCILNMTKKDYELKINKIDFDKEKLNITSSCGHLNNIYFYRFINQNKGINCPKCSQKIGLKNAIEKQIENKKYDKIDGVSRNVVTEHNGYLLIKDMIKDKYELKKTVEGCLVDFCIKDKNLEKNLWIPVQLKTTLKKDENNFHLNNDYSNMIVILINITNNKFWMFNGSELINKKKIRIGMQKSIYSDNEFNKNNIYKFLDKYLINTIQKPFEDFNIASTIFTIREQEYVKKREEKLNFLNFQYDEIGYKVYDFIINNYKIQEKVCDNITKKKKSIGYLFGLTKRKIINSKSKFVPYEKDDNDFYWLHICNTSLFYIIPQKDLIDNNYISSVKTNKMSITLHPYLETYDIKSQNKVKANWANKYLYSYDNKEDLEKIKIIFS